MTNRLSDRVTNRLGNRLTDRLKDITNMTGTKTGTIGDAGKRRRKHRAKAEASRSKMATPWEVPEPTTPPHKRKRRKQMGHRHTRMKYIRADTDSTLTNTRISQIKNMDTDNKIISAENKCKRNGRLAHVRRGTRIHVATRACIISIAGCPC